VRKIAFKGGRAKLVPPKQEGILKRPGPLIAGRALLHLEIIQSHKVPWVYMAKLFHSYKHPVEAVTVDLHFDSSGDWRHQRFKAFVRARREVYDHLKDPTKDIWIQAKNEEDIRMFHDFLQATPPPE
jgi:hypothetical protein